MDRWLFDHSVIPILLLFRGRTSKDELPIKWKFWRYDEITALDGVDLGSESCTKIVLKRALVRRNQGYAILADGGERIGLFCHSPHH